MGPDAVLYLCIRMPRGSHGPPTAPAARTSSVTDEQRGYQGAGAASSLAGRFTFSESTTTADGGRLSLPKTPTGSALVSLRGRIPPTRCGGASVCGIDRVYRRPARWR